MTILFLGILSSNINKVLDTYTKRPHYFLGIQKNELELFKEKYAD